MAYLIDKTWSPMDTSGLPRRDRQGCDYQAYVPDVVAGRTFHLDGATAADVADAESAIARFNAQATTLADTEALARLLLRAEAVASSHIEGLQVGGRRLLRAEAGGALGERAPDVTAAEVLGNIAAMEYAIGSLVDDVTFDGILETHRLLLAGSGHRHAGLLREEQNWIGGSSYNPCNAAFVPPPPELVEELVNDLCEFMNDDGLPAVAQAAIAHAQFETIHPFVDGNGRTGRALIHVILRRRGLALRAVPPISLILATRAVDYVAGLTAFRYIGDATEPESLARINSWVATFAAAAHRAVLDAEHFEQRIEGLKQDWRRRLGGVRAGSAAALLLEHLPGMPILTVKDAAAAIDRSVQATSGAIARYVEADVLTQVKAGRRNRVWEAPEAIDAFTDFERLLAAPTGDTRSADPNRPVPARARPAAPPR